MRKWEVIEREKLQEAGKETRIYLYYRIKYFNISSVVCSCVFNMLSEEGPTDLSDGRARSRPGQVGGGR